MWLSCLCSSDLPSLAKLIDSADDELFHSILYNPHHVTHSTLPKETGSFYGLRRRRHNRELLSKSSRLVQSCFLVRMLYKDIYWLFRLTSFLYSHHFTLYTLRFVIVLLKFYWLIDWLLMMVMMTHFVFDMQCTWKQHDSKDVWLYVRYALLVVNDAWAVDRQILLQQPKSFNGR